MKKKAKAKPRKIKKIKARVSKKKAVRKKAKPLRTSKKGPVKSKKSKSARPSTPKIAGDRIGKVTHYFPHVNAAVVKVTKGNLSIGDPLYIKGHTTDLKLTAQSLQIDRAPIQKAVKGDEAGLEVPQRVRPGDQVFKLKT